VSIGRRLIDLARAELNSLLDRAARVEEDDDYGTPTDSLSDKDLEEELDRRRQARQEAEHAANGTRPSQTTEDAGEPLEDRPSRAGGGARPGTGPSGGGESTPGSGSGTANPNARRRPEFRRAPAGEDSAKVRRAYEALEVPAGSDFEAVRRAYRALMRKYHPDLHTSTPEKQKAANEITQRLTDSYKLLEKRLRR
jgi:DnaJ-domain-containing protein 1